MIQNIGENIFSLRIIINQQENKTIKLLIENYKCTFIIMKCKSVHHEKIKFHVQQKY